MRIIAGKFRGRRLSCPKAVTRPTLDRVREALFSILGDITDRRVVDLYAGSGALGLEALSRGARHVILVEADRGAARVVRQNAESLTGDDRSSPKTLWSVIESPVEDCRPRLAPHAPIDLVLADPPWRIADRAATTVPKVVKGLLSPEATVVIGHAARDELAFEDDSGLTFVETRAWGDSALSFLRQSG